MNRFDYARPTSVAEAVQAGAGVDRRGKGTPVAG
jgi:CO/xanthine dehydrogenase FAD-binding subunit